MQAADFRQSFRAGQRWHSADWLVISRANHLGRPQLGLAVGKKVSKKAVVRNKIKRIVRESFRLQVDLPASDFVVVAKPPLADASKAEMRASIERCWRKYRSTLSSY